MINIQDLDFQKMNGLIPAIVQDAYSLQVLMLGFMNEEAVQKTLKTGQVTFYSRTKECLWTKGESSGNFLQVVSIHKDCDRDSLLIYARPKGATCHLNRVSCFEGDAPALAAFGKLYERIDDRAKTPMEGSYTNKLLTEGIARIAQKVGEEAVETTIAALVEDNQNFLGEMTDLFYHTLVLLKAKGLDLNDLAKVIEQRNKK